MTIDRVRKVNVDNLSNEEVDLLAEQIGEKVRILVDEACAKANTLLAVYGLKTKMQIAFVPVEVPVEEELHLSELS